jgi:hypothetical protein
MSIRLVGQVHDIAEENDKSILVGSVRNSSIAFQCKGSYGWPHLTIEQAERLQTWLAEAIAEAKSRFTNSSR